MLQNVFITRLKLLEHAMKVLEKVRDLVDVESMQYGFMPG